MRTFFRSIVAIGFLMSSALAGVQLPSPSAGTVIDHEDSDNPCAEFGVFSSGNLLVVVIDGTELSFTWNSTVGRYEGGGIWINVAPPPGTDGFEYNFTSNHPVVDFGHLDYE